jgi:hypothetical protein
MNNSTAFAIFLLVGTFLTSTITMLPAAYAGGGDADDKKYDKGGDGNKQKVEDDSAGAIADCDWNDIEESDFRCIAAAASDEGIINDGGPKCEECFRAFPIQIIFFDQETETNIQACEAVETGLASSSELRAAIETLRGELGDATIDALIECLTEAGIL